jgi:DNA replication protein DnaC
VLETHIAIVGCLATQAGIKTRCYTAVDLMLQLDAALRQAKLDEMLKSRGAYRLLIIDELGTFFKREQPSCFRSSQSSMKKATLFSPFWTTPQPMPLTTLLDRLLHHSHH